MMMSDLKRGKFSSEFLLPGEFHNSAAFLISCGKIFFVIGKAQQVICSAPIPKHALVIKARLTYNFPRLLVIKYINHFSIM